jgi:preprotein translocase subunit SecG
MLLGILLAILIVICIALIGVILLQQSEGGALGMGGGGGGFMSTRGAGDLLTRTTWILAGLFFFMCLTLTVCSGQLKSNGSVVDRLKNAPATTVPPAPVKAPGGFDAPKPEVQPTPAADPFGNLTGAKPLSPAPEGSGVKKPR